MRIIINTPESKYDALKEVELTLPEDCSAEQLATTAAVVFYALGFQPDTIKDYINLD